MLIFNISEASLEELEEVAERVASLLLKDETIVYPTETVYGLGAVYSPDNVKKVNAIKGREPLKPVILLVLPWMVEDLAYVNDTARELMDKNWPGPTTLLLPSKEGLPWEYVGLRHSPEPFVERLLERLGKPLISTSANRSGEMPIDSPAGLIRTFLWDVDLMVLKGTLSGKPSAILKVEGERITKIR